MTHKHWMLIAVLGGAAVGFFVTSLSNASYGAGLYKGGQNTAAGTFTVYVSGF